MGIKDIYKYEIELKNGTIISNNNNFNPNDVVRISFMSNIYPRHDIIFTSFKFIKRFRRTFIKLDNSIKDVIHCVITDKFRFYLRASTGSILITEKDYELYL